MFYSTQQNESRLLVLPYIFRPIDRFAFDLYRKRLLDVELTFSNPFRMTTMLGYNFDTEVKAEERVVIVLRMAKSRRVLSGVAKVISIVLAIVEAGKVDALRLYELNGAVRL